MFLGMVSLVLADPLPTSTPASAVVMPVHVLSKASARAKTDSVGPGMCGRGLWSVLTTLGYDKGIKSANGQDWEEVLSKAGWVPWYCPSPELAPYGSVLVYLSDVRLVGKNMVGTKGGVFGHAELVAFDAGKRVYVSDAPRSNAGGTVLHNFTRRAWVPPGFASWGRVAISPQGTILPLDQLPQSAMPAPVLLVRSKFDPISVKLSSATLLEERKSMAAAYFAQQ
jgi:hypothetical protein